jgi:hypothetical protein
VQPGRSSRELFPSSETKIKSSKQGVLLAAHVLLVAVLAYASTSQIEAALVLERIVLSEQTSDSSAFLNAMCLLKYVLNSEEHFSYFDPDYPTSGLTVTGLARVYFAFLRNFP